MIQFLFYFDIFFHYLFNSVIKEKNTIKVYCILFFTSPKKLEYGRGGYPFPLVIYFTIFLWNDLYTLIDKLMYDTILFLR